MYARVYQKQINKWDKLYKSAGDEGIDDAELIEQLAKGSAVQKTKDLLYDITESRRFWDVARWVFPFGNAYQEVLTTWTKLLGSNPAVASRASRSSPSFANCPWSLWPCSTRGSCMVHWT